MKALFGSILIIFSVVILNCKKDKPDCETKNYGTLKVTYGLSSYRHSVVVTPSGSISSREKITAIGVSSDTLHLAPGTYMVNISSIDGTGAAIDSQNGSSEITQCVQASASVTF
jgi:hypothetical protein